MKTRSKLTLLLLLLALLGGSLQAATMDYKVKALGLEVVSLRISKEPKSLSIFVKSLIQNKIFPYVDNSYRINYDANYFPSTTERKVINKKTNCNYYTRYNYAAGSAQMTTSDKQNQRYSINRHTRELFSLIMMFCDGKGKAGTYELDANGSMWKARAKYLGASKISTKAGDFQTQGWSFSFSSETHTKPPYVDTLTHNIFSPKNKTEFWVDNKGTLVKAKVTRGLLSASWELVSVSP
ncbi:MAG: hypothetical protein WBI94_06060 [Candidatus Cloacimonadaceae bacterium]|jgi:hypothetical protein